jgi:hypothetical protein
MVMAAEHVVPFVVCGVVVVVIIIKLVWTWAYLVFVAIRGLSW